jgi:hypothetical protein
MDIEEMVARMIVMLAMDEAIRDKGLLAIGPTDIALDSDSITEKSMAWIELHEDVLDEAYDMSKEYKEYKDDANQN